MHRRIALLNSLGVLTPSMTVLRVNSSDGSPTCLVWTRYPQLSHINSSKWKLVSKCGVVCVDRNSMGIIQVITAVDNNFVVIPGTGSENSGDVRVMMQDLNILAFTVVASRRIECEFC